ncbi:tripartite tricarboxylate transporter substrate binding protein [Sulfurospirillum arcachonense]|uniref:tripartite tricarboxylate transporter substrate binding protein n=1 Tax=Sulfurospirillum arcachonense TaxID=57666 RepID=UPI000468E08F|nr:tripartite tricarboxylate transporter substrate-binding protein [Sulfurospirillum arcachonense]
MKYFIAQFITLIFLCTCNLYAKPMQHIHFLIPGGRDGGWDITARGVGEVLTKSGLLKSVSYENMSGGGGSKAISYLIETANTQKNTLMINSTPIVIRSLQKNFPESFRDLTLIASIITDYQVLAVRHDSSLNTWDDILLAYKTNPKGLKIGGGSRRGGLDHLVAAQIIKAAGADPKHIRYIPHDAGGRALAGLLSGEVDVLSTGFGEVFQKYQSGEVNIIGVTASLPVKEAPMIPTFKSFGVNMSFVNWRGFFGAPGLNPKKVIKMRNTFKSMLSTPEWESVRTTNGWSNLYKPGVELKTLLINQEKTISSVMRELGFL